MIIVLFGMDSLWGSMSNLHLGLPYPGGVVDHSSSLANDIGALYLNDEYSDVTLQVSGHTFHAHRVILAARSQYFRLGMFLLRVIVNEHC